MKARDVKAEDCEQEGDSGVSFSVVCAGGILVNTPPLLGELQSNKTPSS